VVLVEITGAIATEWEIGGGGSPVIWIGISAGDIRGNCVSWEEVYLNSRRGPEHCVHTSSIAVESSSVRGTTVVCHTTPLISVNSDIAVGGGLRASLPSAGHRASGFGVQSHAIVIDIVHTLDDVNLSTVGPARSHCPNRRPSSTSIGHMNDIKQEEPSIV